MSDSQKAQVQAQFGPSAQDYVTSTGHAAGADLERLVAWGRRRASPRVLDVATGGGHTALAFAGFTPVVIAADLTLPMLEPARGFIIEQDREIAEKSGRPPLPIKNIRRAGAKRVVAAR